MSTIEPTEPRTPAEAAVDAFRAAYSAKPEWSCRAPGRVNLMGGHVDYNAGLVLPAAIELEVGLAFSRRSDRVVRIHSAEFDESVQFDIADLTPGSIEGWATYPAGIAWAMSKAGLEPTGIDAAVTGSIPIGGGLSSSAAVEVSFAAAFRQTGGFELSNLELAKLGQTAENKFVGVRCGIMDQVASACAASGHLILLDCRSLELTQIPLPPTLRIVTIDSGVKRELSDSQYNDRRSECEEAVRALAAVDDDITSLRDVSPERLGQLTRHLPAPLDRRAHHVVGEIERVRLAAAALETNEIERFGELLFASHRSLKDDYQVSCDELDSLVELARQAPGIVGARLTGAGFGGCTVNVVSAALADDFVEYVQEGYLKLHGRKPKTWTSDPAAGVSVDPLW